MAGAGGAAAGGGCKGASAPGRLLAFRRGLMEHLERARGCGAGAPETAGGRAEELFAECGDLLHKGLQTLKKAWHWTNREVTELGRQIEGLMGKGKGRRAGATEPGGKRSPGVRAGSAERLGCERCLFFMGWPAAVAEQKP